MAEDEQKEKNNSEVTKLPKIDITPLVSQIHINPYYEQLKQIESEQILSIPQSLNNISQPLSDINDNLSAKLHDITNDLYEGVLAQFCDIIKDLNEGVLAQLHDITKDLNEDVFAQFRDITIDLNEGVLAKLRDLTKDLNEGVLAKLHDLTKDWYDCEPYRSLGKRNWIFPLTKEAFPENILESENLDETIAELYIKNNLEMFRWTINEIKNNLTYISQKQMVEDAESSFNNKNYSACCYTLAPLIEGVLVDKKDLAKTNLEKLFNRYCSAGLNSLPPVGYSISILSSLCGFIDNYCKSSNFSSGSEPEYINRHWMLHGRTHKIITKIDCLQLIGALWAILEISKNIDWDYIIDDDDLNFVKEFRSG